MKTRTLHRNKRAKEKTTKKMECKMQELQERFTTDVFTVDSIAYFDHTSHLTRTETEIPRLHDVLRSLNKSINQKLTRDYVNEAKGVLSLVQSIQLDTDENMTKAEVRKKLEKKLKEALKILDGHFDSLNTILERSLEKSIKESMDSHDMNTEDMFSSVYRVDSKINYKTYQAMCRKNGCHWPKNWNESIDLNKYLSKYMRRNIEKEFKWMFPVPDDDVKNLLHDKDNKRKSVKEKLDEFSIISTALPEPSMLYHLENFIKTQENKLKESLSRDILDRKKEIYSSISTVIQKNMTPGYQKAAEEGDLGAQKRMEEIISKTIKDLKPNMFNEAKKKVLEMFQDLKGHVHQTLDSELRRSLECSLSLTGKITQLDVPKMIQELDTLLEQLSDV
nr:nuclear GTPase SLIP-GC-like [Misgurnus anguillicaudatus]